MGGTNDEPVYSEGEVANVLILNLLLAFASHLTRRYQETRSTVKFFGAYMSIDHCLRTIRRVRTQVRLREPGLYLS